ncbi:hypothetical protein [Chitinophaga rhizophila]|uniref:Uncharacterized protein n=1 Tax=Chitinophaga rhizophila TaxID=2866212 RepID=A0ABS7G7K7_9BACT|nr:hypothetical protein [Chitinophaga rhizophila]MBW8683280.1 hypothetical protein [Chitinophaga rhizophila]
MRYFLNLFAFVICILSMLTCSAQIAPGSAIELGAGLGRGIVGKIKDGKKKKSIESSISEHEINGSMIKVLRVPENKIISDAKSYIVRIQNQLDSYYELYKNNEHLTIPYYYSDINTLEALDKDWATEYYENELKEYRNYEQSSHRQKSISKTAPKLQREQSKKELLIV